MKKVSLVLAIVLGVAASSFAQLGGAKCGWGNGQDHGAAPISTFQGIDILGINDSGGDLVYSVDVTADFNKNSAHGVYLVENKTQKRISMHQMSPGAVALPGLCGAGQWADYSNARAYRSPLTKIVVYVSVRKEDGRYVYVFVHSPTVFTL